MSSPSVALKVNYLIIRYLYFRGVRGDLQEGNGCASRCQLPLFPVPIPVFPSTKSAFLCAFGLRNPHFRAFRAQNRGFCVRMGDFSEILGCFDTKSAFLCSWMAAASPAVPAEVQQGLPELSTARHEPCGVHLAAVRPAIDCRNPLLPRAPATRPGRNVIA